MSKTVLHRCDNCGKEITDKNPVIAKLFMAPVLKSRSRADHSSYTRHCDIGQCCVGWLNKIGWTARMSRAAYQDSRRTRSNGHSTGSVGTRKAAAARKA